MSDYSEEMSINDLRNEIIKFNNSEYTQSIRNYYLEKTYPEILGVSRRELSHSNFISWVLSINESHGLGDFGIRRFLEILVTSKFWHVDKEYKSVFDDVITGNFKLIKSELYREYSIGEKGRIDLLVEIGLLCGNDIRNIRLVIENKVLSNEGIDQTNRYYEYFSKRNDEYINVFVYLTAISSLDLEELSEPECVNKQFIQINYQEIVDRLLEPVIHQNVNSTIQLIVEQYIQSLSQPALDEMEFERGMIMAIGKDERELLEKFWNSNQKIILAALYAISSDPNQDPDVRDNVKEALDSIAVTGKDRSNITLYFDSKEYAKIKKSDLGLYTVKLLNEHHLIDKNTEDWLKEDTSCSFKLLKKKQEVTGNEAKYTKYRINNDPEVVINGTGYYVARNWSISRSNRFIEKIEGKYRDIKYSIEKT